MEVVDIPLEKLKPNSWNPNSCDDAIMAKLERSIEEFGEVENLVVRPKGDGYEIISGEHRWELYKEIGKKTASCQIVKCSDAKAKILSQLLNRLRGEDDISRKAALYGELAELVGINEIMDFLPDSEEEINDLLNLANMEFDDVFDNVNTDDVFEQMTFVLSKSQKEIVEKALDVAKRMGDFDLKKNKNINGNCLELICADFLAGVKDESNS